MRVGSIQYKLSFVRIEGGVLPHRDRGAEYVKGQTPDLSFEEVTNPIQIVQPELDHPCPPQLQGLRLQSDLSLLPPHRTNPNPEISSTDPALPSPTPPNFSHPSTSLLFHALSNNPTTQIPTRTTATHNQRITNWITAHQSAPCPPQRRRLL